MKNLADINEMGKRSNINLTRTGIQMNSTIVTNENR